MQYEAKKMNEEELKKEIKKEIKRLKEITGGTTSQVDSVYLMTLKAELKGIKEGKLQKQQEIIEIIRNWS